MSDSKITNLMTVHQVKRQLKSIHTDKSDLKTSLLKLVDKFKCMDQVAKSTGLVNDDFSFVNRVSWNDVFSKLESSNHEVDNSLIKEVTVKVSQAQDQLENNLIPQLQKMRNKWMFEVILIEFVFLGLIALAIASVFYMQGLLSIFNIPISVEPLLYERPVFIFITGIVMFLIFIKVHFNIRNFVANYHVRKVNNESSEFSFGQALLKNTRMQHSIFRPDIVGWGWFNKKCMGKNELDIE